MIFQLSDAIQSLRPGSSWSIRNNDYSTFEWMEGTEKPTYAELAAEVIKLQSEYDAKAYQRLRAKEYPDFREYLDGIVKNDTDQINQYIQECLAVKEKYPKPSGEV